MAGRRRVVGPRRVTDRRREREAEFVAFATARTPMLFRLALLLTGEWYAAEDLVLSTLAAG